MQVLVGVDSISDFENSVEIGSFFKEELSDEDVRILPFLDGGKGTVEVMKSVIKGDYQYVNVHDPLNDVITSRYVTRMDLAVMEMAQSSGLRLIYKEDLRVMDSSSLGFGEMLMDGLNKGAKKFFIGIGDTATHDLGMGMLYALGVKFFNKDGMELNPSAKNMIEVEDIDFSNLDRRIYQTDILVATSLNMTLFGENSFLDTRPLRKGANAKELKKLREGSKHFYEKLSDKLGIGHVDFPSLGSGGGVAWALYSMFRAKVENSMDLILELVDFEKILSDVDVLVLGEDVDQFEGQSSLNLAKLAKRYKPDIRVYFLQNKKSKQIQQSENIDKLIVYDVDDNADRSDMEKEIKNIARSIFANENV